MIGAPARRLYRDYVRPERLGELDRLVGRAVDLRYETMTLSAFAALARAGELTARPRVLLLRHDVDSDLARARRMWEIERRRGVVGSWFFRRSTWDLGLMRELRSSGCDVGYHYEELATLVKERGIAGPEAARRLVGPARERLRDALAELRADSGLPLDVVAAHGDFANRAVGISNVELLADPAFRADAGVRLEAYDIEDAVDARASDSTAHGDWWPLDPGEALERGARVVEVLVHPRAWGAAPVVNARMDLQRLVAGARYGARVRRRARPRPRR